MSEIAENLFYGCSNLTSITIPESVTSIGSLAFSGCVRLASVNIPEGVTTIGHDAFDGCRSLTSVIIPEGVEEIGNGAFWGCKELSSVTIPNSVVSVGARAFKQTAWFNSQPDGLVYAGKVAYCYKGTMPAGTHIVIDEGTLGITGSLDTQGGGAFEGCNGLTSIYIPSSVINIDAGAFNNCSGLTEIVVATENSKYDSRENCNAIIETSSNTLVAGCKNTIIPNSVTGIGWCAFYGCSGLTSISFPESLTTIDQYAFCYCTGLTTLTIPNKVTRIACAFRYCSGLTSVTLGSGVKTIYTGAFYKCSSLSSVISKVVEPFSFASSFSYLSSDCVLTVPKGTKDAYISKGWTTSVFKGGIVEDGGIFATISAAGYATYINMDYDLNIPDGLTAFTVMLNNGSVTMTEIEGGKIPANTPVVLKGAAYTYEFSFTTGAGALGENGLRYTTAPLVSDGTQYNLTTKASHGTGFYKVKASVTIPAGKVYLQASSAYTKEFFGLDEDDATGISVSSVSSESSENIYNLSGQRISKMQRGINIINGKKVLK